MSSDGPDSQARRVRCHPVWAGGLAIGGLLLAGLAVTATLETWPVRPPADDQDPAPKGGAPARRPAVPAPAKVRQRGYVCYRAPSPVTIDGRLDDPAWRAAPWTEDFVDIT